MDYYIEYIDIEVQNNFVRNNIMPLLKAEKTYKGMQNSIEIEILLL